MAPTDFLYPYVTQFPGKLHKFFCSIDCVCVLCLKRASKALLQVSQVEGQKSPDLK